MASVSSRSPQVTPVIMSGGSGTRLWPLSTAAMPKQFHPLGGELTMIQATALRFHDQDGFSAPVIICNRAHETVVRDQLAAIGVAPLAVVLEPFGRNTAAVAAIAARIVQKLTPGALALLAPADHVIADEAGFRAAVGRAATASGRIVTFGIAPTGPETGYGYIQQGAALGDEVFEVARFAEKPPRAVAEAYIAEGGYAWNGGIFLFAPEVMLAELGAHRPDILHAANAAFDAAPHVDGVMRLEDAAFDAVPSESVDIAVMEPTRLAAVAPCAVGWADIGSWSELWRLGAKDARGNVNRGEGLLVDVDDCLVWAEPGLDVGVVGLRDVMVVAVHGAVVVLPKDRAQDVKRVVEALKRRCET